MSASRTPMRAVLRRAMQAIQVLMYRCPANAMIGTPNHVRRRWCDRWLFHDGSHTSGGWGWS